MKSLDDLPTELLKLLPGKEAKLYTDIPVYDQSSNSQAALEWLKRANSFPLGTSFLDVRPLIASLRTYKDQGEIDLIRKATQASVAAHLAAMKAIKPAITERELSALLQYEWGKRGCERSDDSRTAQAGEVVVIDAGGEYSLYATDITRTLPVSGKFTPRQREIYDVVLGAQQAAMAAFQSGKSHLLRKQTDSLYEVAYDYINTHGKDMQGEPLGRYFIHGLSHYVGLNVHDEGDYEVPVGPGVVFTIEPGIYIPEEKLGVRIEDTFYVDKDGKLINLSGGLP
ncbi:MAG: peptidase M24, partial [Acidobacteria bacterium]